MAGVGSNALAAPLTHRERLRHLVDRMLKRLRGGSRVDRRDFYRHCVVLAKSIDYVIASNQIPHSTKELLQLFKQVCTQKDDTDVRPAIIVLTLSIKGAMQSGWFNATDNGDLFATMKLISDQTGDDKEVEPEDSQMLLDEESALTPTSPEDNLLSGVLSRYFPKLKIRRIILSVKAKPGYRILTNDFQIHQPPNPDERLHLFVIRKERIETSTCLVTPPHVNILINGYGVEQRHSLSNDQGPQLPSDCTPMLKVGANFLQVIGNFQAPYAITIASTTKVAVTSQLVHLGNHVLPSQDPAADDELREGPSKISLHCPISRKRMVTPVKGVSCKHLQSFDFDNYLAINERRPSWRCPHCNMHTNCLELRYDQLLGKILVEVAQCQDISEILISQDGSWIRIPSNDHADKLIGSVETEDMNVFRGFVPPGSITSSTETCLNAGTEVVDLTQDDQDESTAEILMESQPSLSRAKSSASASNFPMCTVSDQEDRKPNLELIAALGVPNNSRADAMINHDEVFLRENRVSEGFGSLMQSSCGSQGSVLTFATAVSTVSQVIEGIPVVNYTSGNVSEATALEGEYRPLPDSLDAASLLYNEHSGATTLQQNSVFTDSGVLQGSLDRQSSNHLMRAPITLQALPAQIPLSQVTRVRSTSPNWSVNASTANIANVYSIQATAQGPLHNHANQPTSARSRSGEEFHSTPTWHQQLPQHDLPYRSIHSAQFESSLQSCPQTQGQVFQRLDSPIHFQQAQTITTIQHPTAPSLQRPYVEIPQPAISRSLSDPYHQPSMHSQQLSSFSPQQLQQLPYTYYDPAYWRQQRLTNNTNVSSGTHVAVAGRTSRVANIVQGDRVFVANESPPLSAFRSGTGGIVRPQVQIQDGRMTSFSDGSSRLSTTPTQPNMTAWVAENRAAFPAPSVSQLIGGQTIVSTDQNWRPFTRMRGSMSPGVPSTICVATAGTSNEPIRNTNRVDSSFQSSFSSVPSLNSLEHPFIESPTNVSEHAFHPLGINAALPRHQTAVRPGGTNLYLSIAESLPQRMLLGTNAAHSVTSSSGNSSVTFELAALNDFLFSGIEPCTALPNLPLEPNFN